MEKLGVKHHTFLQALMRRGPLPESETKTMYRELFGSPEDQFFGFLTEVNRELDYVSMEVRGSTNQYDGKLYYGLVNKLANEEAKLGTRLTHPQLTFFKAILESILCDSSASGCMSCMQALNLQLETQTEAVASTSQAVPLKLNITAKEETLGTLVADDWLGRTDDGRICLGTKSFLELRSLFKNFDVPFCEVCNEAAIKAQPCQNEDCNVRMHSYCVPRKFARRQTAKVCPGCESPWRMLSTDGEEANGSDQDNLGPEVDDDDDAVARVPTPAAARTRARRGASQRRLKAKMEESSDDQNGNRDADDDEPRETPSQPSSQGRRVIHSRPKMKAGR